MKNDIYKIDEKCNRCMRCVRDCAAGVWQDVDGEPKAVFPQYCNLCSHCLAVCPRDAVVNAFIDSRDVRPVYRQLLDREAYEEIVVSRRSVRQYKPKPVPERTIKAIIDVARYGPTAMNSQHVGYIVVTDPDRLKAVSESVFDIGRKIYEWSKSRSLSMVFSGLKLHPALSKMMARYIEPMADYMQQHEQGRDLILHNAPVLILLHAPALSFFGSDNCNIAAANIVHDAHARGLGTCYIGFVTLALRFSKEVAKHIEPPKGRRVHAAIVMGYPAYRHRNTVSRKPAEIKWLRSP
ncbi:MAG: nitroreductase family protein [Thermodesulfobacteriota bacterium]